MAHAVDKHVGKKLKSARIAYGMSQSEIASRVGITFQQIQKYETGANRVSASRLYEFASVLGCNISSFFEGYDDSQTQREFEDSDTELVLKEKSTLKLMQDYSSIKNPVIRKKVTDIVAAIANTET